MNSGWASGYTPMGGYKQSGYGRERRRRRHPGLPGAQARRRRQPVSGGTGSVSPGSGSRPGPPLGIPPRALRRRGLELALADAGLARKRRRRLHRHLERAGLRGRPAPRAVARVRLGHVGRGCHRHLVDHQCHGRHPRRPGPGRGLAPTARRRPPRRGSTGGRLAATARTATATHDVRDGGGRPPTPSMPSVTCTATGRRASTSVPLRWRSGLMPRCGPAPSGTANPSPSRSTRHRR